MKPIKRSKQYNLRSLDGVRDLDLGRATYDQKMRGDYSKATTPKDTMQYDDDAARMKRYNALFM